MQKVWLLFSLKQYQHRQIWIILHVLLKSKCLFVYVCIKLIVDGMIVVVRALETVWFWHKSSLLWGL